MIKSALLPIVLAALSLTLLSLTLAASPASAAEPSPNVKAVSAAGSDFGFRLLHVLATDHPAGSGPNDNVFFSPFSVYQALTLAMDGAGGQTQADMAKTLGLDALPQDKINAANAELLPALMSDPKVQMNVANSLWVTTGLTFSQAYQVEAERFYHAQATTLNFKSPGAAAAINGWVRDNTQGRITEIVKPDDLKHSTNVLANTVYFHGLWQSSFDKTATTDALFHLDAKQTKNVFDYLKTPQFQAVRLSYGKGHLSMLVFLPASGTSADAFADKLNAQKLDQWQSAMKPTELTVFLPRFKANYTVTLNKLLAALGMGSAFSSGADFGPMGLPGVHISAVLHKAVLDVDEQGTTAAAATEVETTASIRFPPPTTMRVDHPFVCLLRDRVTGAILFAGIIRDP